MMRLVNLKIFSPGIPVLFWSKSPTADNNPKKQKGDTMTNNNVKLIELRQAARSLSKLNRESFLEDCKKSNIRGVSQNPYKCLVSAWLKRRGMISNYPQPKLSFGQAVEFLTTQNKTLLAQTKGANFKVNCSKKIGQYHLVHFESYDQALMKDNTLPAPENFYGVFTYSVTKFVDEFSCISSIRWSLPDVNENEPF